MELDAEPSSWFSLTRSLSDLPSQQRKWFSVSGGFCPDEACPQNWEFCLSVELPVVASFRTVSSGLPAWCDKNSDGCHLLLYHEGGIEHS